MYLPGIAPHPLELAADYNNMFEKRIKGYAEMWETKPVLDDNGQPKVDERDNAVEETGKSRRKARS